jgi:hypothetical protein
MAGKHVRVPQFVRQNSFSLPKRQAIYAKWVGNSYWAACFST